MISEAPKELARIGYSRIVGFGNISACRLHINPCSAAYVGTQYDDLDEDLDQDGESRGHRV